MFGFLARLLPSILKGVGFIKKVATIPNLIKGVQFVGDIAKRAGEIGSRVAAGIETAKQLPVIGEKVQDILIQQPQIEQRLGQGIQTARQIGGLASGAEVQLQRFVDPLRG